MIFIIEGPDGAGKTTLAKKLSSQSGYSIEHRSQPKTDEEKAKMLEMYEDVVSEYFNIILDRCWYSEMVYGEVMRDKSYINIDQMLALESKLAEQGGVIIYCTGDVDDLWERCISRGEDYIVDKRTFKKICDKYDWLMNLPHKIPVVRYEVKDVW